MVGVSVVVLVVLVAVVVVGVVVVGVVPVGVVIGILSSIFSVLVLECVVEGLAEDLRRASSSKPSGGSGIRVSQSWSLPP